MINQAYLDVNSSLSLRKRQGVTSTGLILISLLRCTGSLRSNLTWSVGLNILSKLAIFRSCMSSDLRRRLLELRELRKLGSSKPPNIK